VPSEKPPQATVPQISKIHNNFIGNLESLRGFLDKLTPEAIRQDNRQIEITTNVLKKLPKILGIPENSATGGAPAKLK
jgi:hypothetical protein